MFQHFMTCQKLYMSVTSRLFSQRLQDCSDVLWFSDNSLGYLRVIALISRVNQALLPLFQIAEERIHMYLFKGWKEVIGDFFKRILNL